MSMVFVFGSNLAGRHGKGSAKYARDNLGAVYSVNRPTITRLLNGTTWSNLKCAA